MNMELAVSAPPLWTTYFNRHAAVEAVYAHVAALPSSRTDEQHTAKVYRAGLLAFTTWAGDALPTPDLLRVYIAHLVQRGLKSSTIASRYLAPVRHYLKHLGNQSLTGLAGPLRDQISDCRDQIRQAAALPSPKDDVSTNVAPLWRPDFNRLDLQQVNAVLRGIDRSTMAGLRDYALLHIAFSTGLRLAELARIHQGAIQPSGAGGYLITVRGKRSNIDPVPISATAHGDLVTYIQAFNAGLEDDDPRRIVDSVPVWQPMHRETFYMATARYNPARGLSHQAIRDLIYKRSRFALGKAIAPHDTRRTAAALAYGAGMSLPDIQLLLRHKNPSVTLNYIGTKPDFHTRALDTYVKFG
jgi:site-specific recombinase XerD